MEFWWGGSRSRGVGGGGGISQGGASRRGGGVPRCRGGGGDLPGGVGPAVQGRWVLQCRGRVPRCKGGPKVGGGSPNAQQWMLRRFRCVQIFLKNIQCVVCVFSSHSFWTSSSLDVPAGVTQAKGHTGFLIHLSAVRASIFLARRIQPFISLVDCEVGICVLTISFSSRWAFLVPSRLYP